MHRLLPLFTINTSDISYILSHRLPETFKDILRRRYSSILHRSAQNNISNNPRRTAITAMLLAKVATRQ